MSQKSNVVNMFGSEPLTEKQQRVLAEHLTEGTAGNDIILADGELTADDVYTFMRVLRQIQSKSRNEQVSIEVNPEFLSFELTEVDDTRTGPNSLFFDSTRRTRQIMMDFPMFILDVNRSRLERDPKTGEDVLDTFTTTLRDWFKEINIPENI